MTTPVTNQPVATVSQEVTVKITTQTHKECLGHNDSVGKAKTREKVRAISEKKLAKFQNDAKIKADTCITQMTVKEGAYEVFMKYFHQDDVDACDHFQTVSLETTTPVVAVKA